ncbi:putative efflux pump membrane fusion protein [Gimesia panareensis]|uniref:Putative efflux pump membrane fusion protein n=1 Tax=Gimesia panareensis TaxID=2527978 RepID=A0A517QE51_9PLAN|nr:efflux RND transporter periplasmic adaptor subunit [Gimesia panareensis]QDT29922.1 putative efflux pump membrane fusion protein [Gimesia panareensis]
MKKILGLIALGVVLILALIVSQNHTEPFKVSGFIEADDIRPGSRVGGRVKQVLINEGQQVIRGELLIELEPYDLLERRAEAEAALAEAKAYHSKLVAGFRPEEIAEASAKVDQLKARLTLLVNGPRRQEIESAVAELRLADAQYRLAKSQQSRIETLFAEKTASQDELDTANTELQVAAARKAVKEQALELLKEGTRKEEIDEARAQLTQAEDAWQLMKNGSRREDIEQAAATVKKTEANLQTIEKQISELKITSPADGVVEAVDLEPGDLVGSNVPVVSILDLDQLWVRCYVPENHLDIHVDQKVKVTIDSYPDREFAGVISFVSRQAEFVPRNVQTPEERSKQVFRVRVRLQNQERLLRPGMSADVWLDQTGDRS